MSNSPRSRRALLLAGGCCSSLLAAGVPSAAWAQTVQEQQNVESQQQQAQKQKATPTPGDTNTKQSQDQSAIVVTGIRASLRNSINIKKNSDSIVEAVSAEDIGKLPDISIADSIARLPGLAAQRVEGRAEVISLRGLSPDFTTVLLNGRQQASSGENRNVEFDQYPSELLQSVVVYKTPDANIAGMGLAGTVDLRTVRPLQFGKRAIAINLRGELNDAPLLNHDMKRWGWRGSISYIDKLTPTLGIALGYAHLDSPSSNRHFKAYNYEVFPGSIGGNPVISPADASKDLFLDGQEIFAYNKDNKRDGAIGILEWQPSDRVHTVLDLYYSRFSQVERMRGAQWFSNVWADSQTLTNVQTKDIGGTPVAVSGTVNGVAPQLRNDYNTRKDHLFSVGLNNEYKLTDELSFRSDLSYSRNKRDEVYVETYAGYGCCTTAANQNANRVFDTISWDISGNGFPTYSEGLNYADASQVSLGDRAPWGGWGHDGLYKAPHIEERVSAADGDFHYTPLDSAIKAIDVGANFTRRHKNKDVGEWDLFLKNDRMQTLVPSNLLEAPVSLGFAGFGDVLAVKLPQALDQLYDFSPTLDSAHYDKSWDIKEDVLTLKARAEFAFGRLHGNIGVQGVRQHQVSTGQRIDVYSSPISIAPVEQGATYWDWLPSLNTYYDLGGGHRIRFAASKVMARPRMDDMRANLTPGFGNPCLGGIPCTPGQTIHPWSASGGNPLLRPWRAKALDVSYEWYIGPASYFAVAAFYKKLDTYIYNQLLPYDFSGLEPPADAGPIPPGVIVSPLGTITQPANGKGGNVRGIEVSGALELKRITPLLDGFGVLGSFSKTKSNLNPTSDSSAKVRIPGLSGTVYDITGYYEKYGFQARVSYRYRSPFKGEVVALYTNLAFTDILADKQVDAQIGYTFPKTSYLHDLGIQLQVYNLTNSPYRTRIGLDSGGPSTSNGGSFVETYEKYGRQWLLGLNYKF